MPDVPFTVFSGIGFLLCIPPAYFNWKIPCRPWATLILIGWIFMINLLYFVDSIVWASPDLSTWWDGKVYCDINARIKDMFAIGVPGAAIGICRFLADATNPDPSQKDLRHTRNRRNMIDLFLGVILPILMIGLKFIAEPSRYHVAGVNGCTGTIARAWPGLLCYILWPTVLCLIAAGYACTLCALCFY
jgi:pheromone a factor receptor